MWLHSGRKQTQVKWWEDCTLTTCNVCFVPPALARYGVCSDAN